jgi:hypothetical protein
MGFFSGITNAVSDFVGGAVDIVSDAVDWVDDTVQDAGHWIDDKVNDEIPGGWGTVAAAAGAAAYFDMFPTEFGFGEAAAAGAGDAAASSSPWLLGGSEVASPWGISTTAGELGVMNPATIGGFGIDTAALGGMEWLGGAGSLAAGTAGLTAAQLANAAMAGQYGSNAASGLGYLGGASSLPSGTAGIQGVSSTPVWDKVKKVGESFLDSQQQQQGGNTGVLLAKGLGGSQQDIPLSYNMNQSPFQFTTQLPIQTQATPETDLSKKTESLDFNKINQNLASLLRNQ